MSSLKAVTNEDFEQSVIKANSPVLVDFYADWCGPCKTVAPILEELDVEYDGVDIYKVDTEAQAELAAVFGIQSIPSLLFVPLGEQPHSRGCSAGAPPAAGVPDRRRTREP